MALRDINLIPQEILDRKEMRRHLTFWTVCLGILLSPVFGYYVHQTRVASAQQQVTVTIPDINRQLNRHAAKIKTVEAKIGLIDQQLGDLETMLKPAICAKILNGLAGNMNANTWLDTLSIHRQSGSGDMIRLLMDGYADSNGALGDLLNRLSGDPGIDSVVLKYAKEPAAQKSAEKEKKKQAPIAFEIECMVSQG